MHDRDSLAADPHTRIGVRLMIEFLTALVSPRSIAVLALMAAATLTVAWTVLRPSRWALFALAIASFEMVGVLIMLALVLS